MPRTKAKIKERHLSARVDDETAERIFSYLTAKDMTMGDLIRRSIREFMDSYPPRKEPTNEYHPLAQEALNP